MKIVGSRSGIHSPEFHKKKRRERRVRLVLVLTVLIILIGLPIYLLRTRRFLIASVQVSGNTVTKDEDIESIVSQDLARDYLLILPKSNALLYPHSAIVRDLLARIPRLAEVSVHLVDARTLSVSVSERTPVALYCSDISNPLAPTGCSLIDAGGFIFAPAPDFSGGVYLTYADESSSTPARELGSQFLPVPTFVSIQNFVSEMHSLGIYPRDFVLENDEYHMILSNGGEIMWEKATPLDTVASNLSTFLSSPAIARTPDFLDRILYIDLRFDNKVFYKFRDGS